MCSDCSVFRYFEISRKKHRVCSPCNNELARVNRLTDSDAQESFDRSVVTDDDVHATPSDSAVKKRGKLRENMKKTFTPRYDKKKEDRRSVIQPERKNEVVQRKTHVHDQVVRPKQHEDDERKQNDLFDSDDDTWFADPVVGENGGAEKKDRHLHIDDLNDDFMRDEYAAQRSSAAQSKQRTAAEEWQDAMSRQTIAASGGARVPTSTRQDSLSIDAYGSRSDDDYDLRRGGGMEMPRPQQQQIVAARVQAEAQQPTVKQTEDKGDDRFTSHGRPTLKESLKDIFHVHGKKNRSEKRKSKREESSESKAAPSLPPTPVKVAQSAGPAQPTVFTQVRPTFYEADVDQLVVDDTPGYFGRVSRETSSAPVGQQRAVTVEDVQWGAALLPPTVEPRAIAIDQESYSIVEPLTESPGSQETGGKHSPVASASSLEHNGSGFTGALKRLFGISAPKSQGKAVDAPREAPRAEPQPAAIDSKAPEVPRSDDAEQSRVVSSEREFASSFNESKYSQRRADSFGRFSVAESSMVFYNENSQQDQFRYTMAAEYATPGRDFRQPDPEQKRVPSFSGAGSTRAISQKKRRDTFDDLFASPKSQAAPSSSGAALPTRAWDGLTSGSNFVVPTTGVNRFDRRQDDVGGGYQNQKIQGLTPDIYAIDRSRASSIGLGESSLAFDSGDPEFRRPAGNSWSTVSAVPSYGMTTYAVPSGVSNDRFASSYRSNDQAYASSASTHTTIMDDLNHRPSSAPSSSKQSNSVDDIFAEFERPNDYVFDPETGGYVSASAPKRAPRQQTKKCDLTPQYLQQEPQALMQNRELSLGHYEQSERKPAIAESEDEDGLDDTIVDKISSLEGELAALKQLIRKRKDHDHLSSANRHVNTSSAKPHRANEQNSRKLSIFDHNSSDEDVPARKTSSKKSLKSKGDLKTSPIKTSRKSSKKTPKRRDSFADLFEDSPGEDSTLGGGKGYESLFQTGSGKESGSDDNEAQQRHRRDELSKYSAGARKGRKGAQEDSDSDGRGYSSLKVRGGSSARSADDDEEYPSLKNRGKGAVQRRKTEKPAFRSEMSSDEESKPVSLANKPREQIEPKEVATTKSIKPSRDEFDPIDTLFDSSSERDVNNFFDIGDEKKSPATSSRDKVAEVAEAGSSNHLKTAKLSDDIAQYEAPAIDDADSDDDFAASLAKAKKQRYQRGSLAPAETAPLAGSATKVKKEELDSADISAVDSDEEFALTLKKGRAGALKSTSSDAVPALVDSVSTTSATPAQSTSQDQSEMDEIDSDEEFALSLTKTKASREKTVSLFDQTDIKTESPDSTLGIFDEELESAGVTEEIDQAAGAAPGVVFDSVESVESSTSLIGTSMDGEPEGIDEVVSKMPAVDEGVQESTRASSDALDSLRADKDQVTTLTSPVEVIEAKLNHVLDRTAEVITAADASLAATTSDAPTPSPRKNVELSEVFEDDTLGMFGQSTDVYITSLGSGLTTSDDSEEESDGDGDYAKEGSFSFEVKPKRRVIQTPMPLLPTDLPKKKALEDDDEALVLGKYSTTPLSQQQHNPTESSADPETNDGTGDGQPNSSLEVDMSQTELLNEAPVDTDWQQMQEQEKERKKKLQLKQRQAQRDKLLKKQGASSKQLNASSSSVGNTSSRSSTGEKKKKKKVKSESATPRKKSASSSKHKHKSVAEDEGEQGKENVNSGSTSTLTDL